MSEDISITGITPIEHYPPLNCIHATKQCLELIDVSLPCNKLDIASIEEVKVSTSITKYKVINTILGPKVVLYGLIKLKIIYTAYTCDQSLHSCNWDIPLSDYVLIKNKQYNECCARLNYIFTGIEDVEVTSFNSRNISMTVLYIVIPQLC